MAGIERIMAETGTAEAVAGAQTPVQASGETFSSPDTQKAITEAERILGEARNQITSITPDVYISPSGAEEAVTAQTADTTPQDPAPPGGEGGMGGEGGGEGPPGGPEGPQGPEGPRGVEWETNPESFERGRWLCEEIIRFRTTMIYEERYNEVNGPIYAQRLRELQEFVDAWCETRNDPDPFGPHKAYPKPTRAREAGEPIIQPPEFPPLPQAIQELTTAINQLRDQYRLEGIEELEQLEAFLPESLPTDANGNVISVDTLRAQYINPGTREEFLFAQANLDVYFRQAKNQGLLAEVDAVLHSTYQQITRPGISAEQAEELLERGIARARRIAPAEFLDRLTEDPNLPEQFANVGAAYIDRAHRRLERHLHGQLQPDSREGEWSAPTPEQVTRTQRETYWETTSYPKYYRITARTEEQFLTAKETFFQMIRSGSIGKSPTAIFDHVKNFLEAFGAEGGIQVREGNISLDFLTENRLELEALLYIFVGNYSNEVYNPKQRKEAMMAMSLDEGPARFVAVYRAGGGGVAAFTQIFDMEALMDIYNNPVGERGELDIIAGHFLQDQIQEMVIERGMGIVLKDYDPRDEYFSSDDLLAKIAAAEDLQRIQADLRRIEQEISNRKIKLKPGETAIDKLYENDENGEAKREYAKARLASYRANLQRLGLTRSDEEFKGLYEGFDKGDTHIKNYYRYKADQGKPGGERQFPSLNAKDEKGNYIWPESIRRSIDLGRIQAQVLAFRQAIRLGELKPERGKKAVDLLSPRDREVYQAAFDEALANFDIAFQMQGVLGEKGRKGRGFLYVDRNPHIQYYQSVGDRLRLQWVDKEQTKVINTDALEVEEIEKIRNSLPQANRRSFEIGWMLYKMRGGESGGKRLDSFPPYWQNLYANLSPEDKHDFVDNIPTYQAENFVQWGVFWTKMKYAEAPAKVRRAKVREARARLIEELRTKGYAAQLWDDFTLLRDGKPVASQNIGYDKNGRLIPLSFDSAGVPIGIEFDDQGAVIFDKPKIDDQKHEIRDRRRIKFDNLDRNTRFSPRLMTVKRPLGVIDSNIGQFRKFKNGDVIGYNQAGQEIRLSFDHDGKPQGLEFDQDGKAIIYDKASADDQSRIIYDNINVSTRARLHAQTGIFIEEAVATFQITALSSDFRNRYTDHTYWYYQGNNRVTILTPRIRAAAERIRDGLSRSEDEDILATQLLIVDPTLRRIKKFEDVDQQREVTLIAAAVLESFQDKQRTKHALHRAFLPKDGFVGRMRAGYRNEDWAGMDRFTMGFEEFAGQQPLRFARRGMAWIGSVPMEHDAAGPRWGVHGASGAIAVMADEIKKFSHQGIVGQFGLTKIFETLDKAVEMFNALVGYTDPQTGEHVFGTLEKPTDNNEQLHENYADAIGGDLLTNPSKAIPFLYKFLKAVGRLQRVTHIMRVMDTDNDNSAGALDLEEVDVFDLKDGSFNTEIETNREILLKNGTARNRQYAFLYGEDDWEGFYNWLVSKKPGGGADVYKKERFWNSMLKQQYHDFEAEEYSAEGLKSLPVAAGLLEEWVTEKII